MSDCHSLLESEGSVNPHAIKNDDQSGAGDQTVFMNLGNEGRCKEVFEVNLRLAQVTTTGSNPVQSTADCRGPASTSQTVKQSGQQPNLKARQNHSSSHGPSQISTFPPKPNGDEAVDLNPRCESFMVRDGLGAVS